jgi:hypothetical protein
MKGSTALCWPKAFAITARRLGGGTVVLTPVFNAIGAAQTDTTVAADYHA